MVMTLTELVQIDDKRLAYKYLGDGIQIIQQFHSHLEYYLGQAMEIAAKPRNAVLADSAEQALIGEMESMLADIIALNNKWQAEHPALLAYRQGMPLPEEPANP